MVIKDVPFMLKDGREALLRSPREEDIESTLRIARHLYEKMGFRITGVRPNAIRLKNGTFLNEYMMAREINR